MSGQWLLLSALLLPFVAALGIVLCGRWPNFREAVTLVSAAALSLVLIEIYRRLGDGIPLSLQLAEPIPGLSFGFEVEPLGMLFALVAGVLWLVTAVYSIGYMRGHHEKNQTRFYAWAPLLQATCSPCFCGMKYSPFPPIRWSPTRVHPRHAAVPVPTWEFCWELPSACSYWP